MNELKKKISNIKLSQRSRHTLIIDVLNDMADEISKISDAVMGKDVEHRASKETIDTPKPAAIKPAQENNAFLGD